MTFDPSSILEAFGVPRLPHHHFDVVPNQAVGPIEFGMHRDVVARHFTYTFTSFFKNPGDPIRSDCCDRVGLTIHYDANARVRAMEIDTLPRDGVSVSIFGHPVLGLTISQAITLLQSQAGEPLKNDLGYYFPALCLQAYTGSSINDSDLIEALLLTRK